MNLNACNTWECVNSFAHWIAATGTVVTAALALWLSVRDRRINVGADLSLGLVPGSDPRLLDQAVFALSFTNIGPRSVTITNHVWRLPFSKGSIVMFPNIDTPVAHLCSKLPLELTDGKTGHAFYPIAHFAKLQKRESVFFHPNRRVSWLRIWFFQLYLSTSVGKSDRVKVRRTVREALWKQYSDA